MSDLVALIRRKDVGDPQTMAVIKNGVEIQRSFYEALYVGYSRKEPVLFEGEYCVYFIDGSTPVIVDIGHG